MTVLSELPIKVSPSKQPPEIELLLCCARTQMEPRYAECISHLVQQNLKWDYVLQTAQWHGVMPLLHWQLKDICPSAVPQSVYEQLHSAFNANAQKSLVLTGELIKIFNLFKEHDIPIIPFKGPVLARSAYDSLALREFVDLDILVPEKWVLQSSKLIISQGYEPVYNLTEAQEAVYVKLRNEHMFWHKDKQITIDLHWSLMPKNFSFSEKDWLLGDRHEQVYLGSNLVETLSAELLLIFLCAHGAKHGWLRLKWICDLAELIRSHQELDWDWTFAQADKLGTKRMLCLGLYLCQDLLGAVLPQHVFQQIHANRHVLTLAFQVQKLIFSPNQHENKFVKEATIYLKTMESLKDRVWFCFDTVFNPTPLEWAMLPLPTGLFPLYYLIRPVRLTIKHSLRFLPPRVVISS